MRRLIIAGVAVLTIVTVIATAVVAASMMATAIGGEPARQSATPFQRLGIDELAWLAPEADARRFLTMAPSECIKIESAPYKDQLTELGRVAFRSPMLLGGQAARHGLSCNSCHRNGRDNSEFFLEGLSGGPGTADVTHSLFSKSREDGVLNPVPIPTLLDVGAKRSFGTVAPAPSLEAFINSAVIEEFQGAPPPEIIVTALAEYVRRLDSAACPEGMAVLTVNAAISDLERAIAAAMRAIEIGQPKAADFLTVSAQRIAGEIHRRYSAPSLEPQRMELAAFAATLGAARTMIDEDPARAKQHLAQSLKEVEILALSLQEETDRSLYNPETIDAALNLRH